MSIHRRMMQWHVTYDVLSKWIRVSSFT